MPKCILLGLILLILVKSNESDNMLNQFKTDIGDWKENTPKAWQAYIRMSLYKQFDNKTYIYMKNVGNILLQMRYNSKTWSLVSSKTILDTKWIECRLKPTGIRERCTVKRPIGKFIWYENISLFVTSFKNYQYLVSYSYWKLDTKMRLNLTFFTIYFSSGVSDWHLNHLSIVNGFDCSTYLGFFKSHLYFQFFGQYSTFTFYSNYSQVTVCLRNSNPDIVTGYHVEGMFAILDRDQLVNTHVHQWTQLSPELLYNVQSKYTLCRYFISVSKFDCIIIKIKESNKFRYDIHDGPGLLADTLHIKGSYTITSTFQCLMLVLTPNDNMPYDSYFNFTSKMLSAKGNININQIHNSLFTFPNQKCRKGLCISLVKADLGYQVNITSILVKSASRYNFNCIYAGLVAGERLVSEYEESKTIFESNYGSDSQFISFYSHNSSLILVLYWYKGYSEINVSVMISQTKCKPVFINLCILHILCFANKIRCLIYLNSVRRLSGINLIIYSFDSILFEGNIGECWVLHFSSMLTEFKNVYNFYLYLFLIQAPIPTSCRFLLIPSNAAVVHVRLGVNRNDFTITESKLDVYNPPFKNISEPMIPRLISRYTELSPGTVTLQDASLTLNLKKYPTNSWIELVINSVATNLTDIFKRFARDFVFTNNSIIDSSYRSGYGILVLKSNTKTIDPNVSLMVYIHFINYSMEKSFPWKEAELGK